MTSKSKPQIGQMCRTCMCKAEDFSWEEEMKLQSIYELPTEGVQELRIVELLISIAPLLIKQTDELPKTICTDCLKKLLSAYHFQQLCIRSDQNIRSLMYYNTEIEEETKFSEVLEPTTTASSMFDYSSVDPLLEVTPVEELKNYLKLEMRENYEDESSSDEDNGSVSEYIDSENESSDSGTLAKVAASLNKNNLGRVRRSKRNGCLNKSAKEANIEEEFIDIRNEREIEIDLPCLDCDEVFATPNQLREHVRVHKTPEKPYVCVHCTNAYSRTSHLKRHISKTHKDIAITAAEVASVPEGYKCNQCPRRFALKESLKKHKQSHSKLTMKIFKLHVCPECGKQFKTTYLLLKHRRKYHEIQIDEISESSLHSAKPYLCEYCNKGFQQSCTLKDHIRTHTGEQPFLCSECGKAFNSSSNMKQHLLRHSGEKRYECPECPKKFPCLSDLASHKAVHKKFKPHVCDICGSSFGKPYQLKKHKMYHNGEKPHKCEFCDMRFVCADHMRRHTRTHTGEKPYKCKYCERAFAQSNDLIKHLRSHLGENVYKCELCPSAFRLATELREHFAEHKNDDDVTRQKNIAALMEEEANIRTNLLTSIKNKQQLQWNGVPD